MHDGVFLLKVLWPPVTQQYVVERALFYLITIDQLEKVPINEVITLSTKWNQYFLFCLHLVRIPTCKLVQRVIWLTLQFIYVLAFVTLHQSYAESLLFSNYLGSLICFDYWLTDKHECHIEMS